MQYIYIYIYKTTLMLKLLIKKYGNNSTRYKNYLMQLVDIHYQNNY